MNPHAWLNRGRTFIFCSARPFSTIEFKEPKSITELHELGASNLALTKEYGLDYANLLKTKKYGITNKSETFINFEEQINQQFELKPTEATTRLSKRVGLLGYKIGCTHFWDRWGVLTPCTVV